MRTRLTVIGVAAAIGCALIVSCGNRGDVGTTLPVTREAKGRKITLSSLRRMPDGRIMAILLAHPAKRGALRLSRIGRTTITGEPDVEACWGPTKADGTVEIALRFRLARRERSFSLQQQLRYSLASTPVSFRFRGVAPSALPVTSKCGPYAVKLESVLANQPVKSNQRRKSSSFRWTCLRRPEGYNWDTAYYSIVADVPRVGDSHVVLDCKLTDDRSRVFAQQGLFYDSLRFGAELAKLTAGTDRPTAVERQVALANPQVAGRIYSSRQNMAFNEAHQSVRSEVMLFAFPAMRPPPKKITVEFSGRVYRREGDSVTARFDGLMAP